MKKVLTWRNVRLKAHAVNQNTKMKTYYISTNNGSEEIKAENVMQALEEWGVAPAGVNCCVKFEAWLEKVGGYGVILEDGVQIARVSA